MSYILDALKKSDNERKQGDVPNLQTVHIPISVEPQTQWVLYGFISLLLLILAFVIGMMISDNSADSSSTQQEEQRQSREVGDVYVSEVKEKAPSAQKTQKVTAQLTDESLNSGIKDNTGQQAKKIQLPTVVEVMPVTQPQKANIPIKSNRSIPDISKIPYLEELPEYQQQSIPQMTFAGHVYSTNPDNRSVIINDYFMSEGDTVVQGIDVVEITTSGVIFSFHDSFFRMDILLDWSFEE